MPPRSIRVWDGPVRLLHWGLALSVIAAWTTIWWGHAWHERAGYAALTALALRTLWCWRSNRAGQPRYFVQGPRATWQYLQALRAGRERRYLSHNPLGGWMALLLWSLVGLTGFTGWLYTTDAFWGMAWLDQLHQALAWSFVVAVPLHLAGVVFTSLRHRENLVRAMVTGRKRLGRDRR